MMEVYIFNENEDGFYNKDVHTIQLDNFCVVNVIEAMKSRNWKFGKNGKFKNRKFFAYCPYVGPNQQGLFFETDSEGNVLNV